MGAFRGAERTALDSELDRLGRVIALGGGTPTADGCAELLREGQSADRCRVVYLKALPVTLRSRLESADNSDRPSLTGGDVLDEIETVFAQRDPLYMDIAESVIHVDHVSLESSLSALIALAHAGA